MHLYDLKLHVLVFSFVACQKFRAIFKSYKLQSSTFIPDLLSDATSFSKFISGHADCNNQFFCTNIAAY